MPECLPTDHWLNARSASRSALPQHPNQHRARRLVLLAVDQELGERAALSGEPQNSPIRSARSKSGSMRTWSSPARGSRPERVQALRKPALELVGSHGWKITLAFPQPCSPPGRSETPTNTRRHERVSVEGLVALWAVGFKSPLRHRSTCGRCKDAPRAKSRSRGHCLPVVCPVVRALVT